MQNFIIIPNNIEYLLNEYFYSHPSLFPVIILEQTFCLKF